MNIMTATGWVRIGDTQTIKRVDPRSPRQRVIDDVYCGWTPSARGPLSAAFCEEFNRKVAAL